MFVIKVCGEWGSCYTDENNEPVFKTDKAKKFLTRQAAADHIGKHFREWEGVAEGKETMTVEQM